MREKRIKEYISKAICVDFDGVIAEFSEDIKDFGNIIPGCGAALQELRKLGYKIIIHTARPAGREHIAQLADYLRKWEIPFDEINTNSDCLWPAQKPLADLYIDDRALRFEGNWKETLKKAKQYLSIDEAPRALARGAQSCTCVIARDKLPNKNLTYEELLRKVTKRTKEVSEFENFLRTTTSWLASPASTRYHLPKKGGLVEHSLNVANALLTLRAALAPELSEESCVIAALYHDIGKIGMPGKPYYLPNPNEWQAQNRGIYYIINKDLIYMDIATRSLYLVAKYIPLAEDETQAIRYHDGQYVEENKCVAHKETKLTRLLQYADNWSGGVVEIMT